MPRNALLIIVACLVLPLAGLGLALNLTPGASARLASDNCERAYILNGTEVSREAVDPSLCGVTPPTATAEPTATMSMPMPTQTPGVALGWHPPGSHDGLNVHEHGDEPPAWVYASGHQPFTQSRESHTGYKGAYDTSPGGAQSYLITHILSTSAARSHGDHDYQLWLRNPATGEVLYYAGVLDFGNPPPLRTTDTGERPIILGERNATDGCETWYSRPGVLVMDLGWTICGRYQDFAGNVLGGLGATRTADWVVPCDRLPAASTLRQDCRTEFGVSRLSFLINTKNYNAPGLAPIN